jgi:hypothetical protein
MKNRENKRLVKYINVYLQVYGFIATLAIILGFGMAIASFVKNGKLNQEKFSMFKINLITPVKETIINPFIDGLVAITFGLLISLCVIVIVFYLLKFVKNIISSNLLIKENGRYLKIVGLILGVISFVLALQDMFLNLVIFNHQSNSGLLNIIMYLVAPILFVAMVPLFWLGMFFILLGKILDNAAVVKQENDLTV